MRWQHDAAGRVVSAIFLFEQGSSQAQYTYDLHDNLTAIKQTFNDANIADMHGGAQEQITSCSLVDELERQLLSPTYLQPNTYLASQMDEDYRHVNSLGQRVLRQKETDERGITTMTTRNALGRIVEVEKCDSFGARLTVSRYGYDSCGHIIEERHGITDPITTKYQYGPMGQLISRMDGSEATYYLYDAVGQLIRIQKPDGVELSIAYDSLGRMIHFSSSDGTVDYSYAYDTAGNPIQVLDHVNNAVLKREYHAFGGITKDESLVSVGKVFDSQGRPNRLILPDGSGIEYEYDSAGLKALHRISEDGTRRYSHEYTKFSPKGQPIEAKMVGAAGILTTELSSHGSIHKITSPWWSQRIDEDKGRVVGTRIWDAGGKYDSVYGYDQLGQLTTETGLRGAQHAYDSLGNRVGWQGHHCDANGNVVVRQTSDGPQQLRYDALNRLIEVLQPEKLKVTFTYDAFNRRQSKTVFQAQAGHWVSEGTQCYIYDDDCEIGVVDGSGEITELRVLGAGIKADVGSAVAIELKGSVFAPIHDSRGCVRCLVAADGSGIAETYRYGAFGEEHVLSACGSSMSPTEALCPWRFSSKRVDSELGLVFFGQRFYDPTIGRWMTLDPLGTIDGPNRYAFVRNDPLGLIDPQGLFSVDTLWDSATTYVREYFRKLSSFSSSLTDLFKSDIGFVNDIIDDVHFFTYQFIGPGLYLAAGLHNEGVEFGVYGNGEFSDKIRISHINGVLNVREGALEAAELISRTHGGINVHYLFRPTGGLTKDIIQGAMTIFGVFGYVSPSATRLAEGWRELIAEVGGVGNGGLIVHYAHSLGGAETANARRLLTPEEQKMIRVTTFGSAKVLPDEGFVQVHNYISSYDGVMGFDPTGYVGAFMGGNTNVSFLSPLGYFAIDHMFTGPTYSKTLRILGERFVALYDPSKRHTIYLGEPEERQVK